MRIGLNLLHALPEIGGGWNYIANLIDALEYYDKEDEFIAFVNGESAALVPSSKNFKSVHVKIRAHHRWQRILFENSVLQALALRYKLDCMHWFSGTQAFFNAVPSVVSFYDPQALLQIAKYPWYKKLYYDIMVPRTIKKASLLLPMSESTAQELQRILHADSGRMVTIHTMLKSDFSPRSDPEVTRFRATYNLPRDFWLYVAHMYPFHKNHLRLLEAYHSLKQMGFAMWPLVLRGDPKGSEVQIRHAIVHFGLEQNVILLPRLRPEELPTLYSAATALVFPSIFEGGGIPVLEAMACGCPVAGSAIPAIKEHASDAARYFDPLDTQSIAMAMMVFQSDPEEREMRRSKGLVQAERFRASAVVSRLQDAYYRVLKQ